MNAVVSVGVFDGLHLGHRAILDEALRRAAGDSAVMVTFDPHPDVVLAKRFEAPAPLTPLDEKRRRVLTLGFAHVEVLPFTRELAALSPEEFVDRHLIAPFGMKALVVGANFALGRGRSGNIERLTAVGRERGFEVVPVPLFELDGAPVSSSRIRERLAHGEVAAAARLLGRRYDLTGRVVSGHAIGRTLGFPTANLQLHAEKLVPANGIYAVWARIADEAEWRPAAMSVGVRPTFGGDARTLEVHLLDWSGELGGRDLTVEFADWLRSEVAFESTAALVDAMKEDVRETRRRLGAAPAAR
jgi:riboflavin kinase/FMN adenylyltransferase